MKTSINITETPMLLPVISLGAGVWCSAKGICDISVSATWWALAVMMLIAVCIVMVSAVRGRRPGQRVLWGLVCVAAFVFGHVNAESRRVELISGEESVWASGHVERVVKRGEQTRFVMRADTLASGDSVWVGRCGQITLSGDISVSPGERVWVRGRLRPLRMDTGSDYEYREHLMQSGIAFCVEGDSVAMGERVTGLSAASGMAQDLLAERLTDLGVSERNRGFLRALVLGDRSLLSEEQREDFADCGIAHVLAVSGMHVGVIFLMMKALLCWVCGVRRERAIVVSAVVTWGYALVAGMSASVFRAAIMLTIMTLSRMTGRRANVTQMISVALFVILTFQPFAIFTTGLWLSVLAVWGILSVSDTLDKMTFGMGRWWKWATQNAAVSIVTQGVTTPVTMYAFHSFPTYFLLNNMLVLPFMAPIMLSALACVALGWVPGLGETLGCLTDCELDILMYYAHWAASLPGARVSGIGFTWCDMMSWTALAMAVVYWLREMRQGALDRLSVVMVAAGLALGGEHFWLRQREELRLDSVTGQTTMSITTGLNATHLCRDTSDMEIRRLMMDGDRDRVVRHHEFVEMRDGMEIGIGGKRVLLVSADSTIVPEDVDICIVMGDRLPQEGDAEGVHYYIGHESLFGKAWEVRRPRVTLCKWRDERVIFYK